MATSRACVGIEYSVRRNYCMPSPTPPTPLPCKSIVRDGSRGLDEKLSFLLPHLRAYYTPNHGEGLGGPAVRNIQGLAGERQHRVCRLLGLVWYGLGRYAQIICRYVEANTRREHSFCLNITAFAIYLLDLCYQKFQN